MQSRIKEATELATRVINAGADPNFDRWATVYNTLGDEIMLCMKRAKPPSGTTRRPAWRNGRSTSTAPGWEQASWLASSGKGDVAAKELEAAARVPGLAGSEHQFAKELLGMLVKPLDGSATVGEAAAALKRLDTDGSRTPGDKPPSQERDNSP